MTIRSYVRAKVGPDVLKDFRVKSRSEHSGRDPAHATNVRVRRPDRTAHTPPRRRRPSSESVPTSQSANCRGSDATRPSWTPGVGPSPMGGSRPCCGRTSTTSKSTPTGHHWCPADPGARALEVIPPADRATTAPRCAPSSFPIDRFTSRQARACPPPSRSLPAARQHWASKSKEMASPRRLAICRFRDRARSAYGTPSSGSPGGYAPARPAPPYWHAVPSGETRAGSLSPRPHKRPRSPGRPRDLKPARLTRDWQPRGPAGNRVWTRGPPRSRAAPMQCRRSSGGSPRSSRIRHRTFWPKASRSSRSVSACSKAVRWHRFMSLSAQNSCLSSESLRR